EMGGVAFVDGSALWESRSARPGGQGIRGFSSRESWIRAGQEAAERREVEFLRFETPSLYLTLIRPCRLKAFTFQAPGFWRDRKPAEGQDRGTIWLFLGEGRRRGRGIAQRHQCEPSQTLIHIEISQLTSLCSGPIIQSTSPDRTRPQAFLLESGSNLSILDAATSK